MPVSRTFRINAGARSRVSLLIGPGAVCPGCYKGVNPAHKKNAKKNIVLLVY